MKIAIVVEAIPPYCGGGEQVAWIHAVEMARHHDVSVVTFGENYGEAVMDGVEVFFLPRSKQQLLIYSTSGRSLLNACIDAISPDVIHCHMPSVLSACISKKDRLFVSTIHDGTPENELIKLKVISRSQWLKFKLVRHINVRKSDIVTCVSRFSAEVMRKLYPKYGDRFVFIPNPIAERFFSPIEKHDDGYVLNYGRQIELKMGVLIEVARLMPDTRFVFVGTGDMVKEYGLRNVEFEGFSDSVAKYIDRASLCVFPSLTENFPLVGLETMARGKPVIASKRGFSEYIEHLKNGFLLDSVDPLTIVQAINHLNEDKAQKMSISREARITAEQYRPECIVAQYEQLYKSSLSSLIHEPEQATSD